MGRTGTFIAIDYLLEQATAEGEINVFHLVQSLRNQRVTMVQTAVSYFSIVTYLNNITCPILIVTYLGSSYLLIVTYFSIATYLL